MNEILELLKSKVTPDICIKILERLKADPAILETLEIEHKRLIVQGLMDAEKIYGQTSKRKKDILNSLPDL